MVGALLHQPRDAAGGDQLGDADHRPAGPRARARHQPAGTGLGDPRLHDLLDRAGPHRRPPLRPLRPQAGLRRRLPRLRRRLARRRLLRRRHPADPLADPAGDRRRLPLRQRPPPSSPTPSPGSSSAWRWGPTRWSPRSGWCWARCSAAPWSRSPGTGSSGSTCRSRSPAPPGARWSCASWPAATPSAGSTSLGTLTFVVGLTGLVYGLSRGGISGWDDPLVIGSLLAAAVLLPLFVLIEHRGSAPMLDLYDLPQPAVRRGHRRRLHQRPLPLRAALRLRLLLPGRPGR